jgi:hypothetical protein
VKERVPVEDQPVGREKAEAAQEGERDGRAEPVASYERQRAEPILKKTLIWNLKTTKLTVICFSELLLS